MAKKRKASSRGAGEPTGPDMDVGESRKRIRTYEDVADSDDEFHLNRDKVLLDEQPDVKRRRKAQEEEQFLQPSDEEIYDQSDSEGEEDFYDAQADQQSGEASDLEQFGGEDEDEEEEGWGTSKADLYGADEIETEEQALEEEAEALRLQKKQLQAMSAADYGFDESEWQDNAAEQDEGRIGATVTEVLPQLQIAEDMAPVERLKLLKSRYPEFEPLSKELLALQEVHGKLATEVQEVTARGPSTTVPNLVTKFRAASAYMGVLAMYFALLTSTASTGSGREAALSASRLREHPVMDSLVQCRQLWQRARDLPADVVMPEVNGEGSDEDVPIIHEDLAGVTGKVVTKPKAQKKSRAQRHAEAVQQAADKRRQERLQRAETDLAGLDALIAPSAIRKQKAPTKLNADDDSDLGEEAPLTAQEAAEKAKRKKSLRFYTSQIAQKANKRGAAGRNTGGDEDVPHRERLRDRQARLNAEAEKRGKGKADIGDDLGGESDEEDRTQARQIRDEADEDDYYDMIAARTNKKKSDKAALAEAQKQAALVGGEVVEQETVGADGKRKISYQIEKNKGLTPHRKKDVRNPRVKKRKKFDEKKKKLASMKPVYKGGEGRGGYGGELTGIKKGLVKSTKL